MEEQNLNAEQVAAFLRTNPDFLARHGDVFASLEVPHPHGGQAITLAERQLHTLRQKISQLESKLGELIRFGEENDVISGNVHRLAVALVIAESADEVRETLYRSLVDDFQVPHVTLRTWSELDEGDDDDEADLPAVSLELRQLAGGLSKPYCGLASGSPVLEWFADAASHIRSMALLPLGQGNETFGLLVLGSEEEHRFYPEMGTLYLDRIAALAAAALLRAPD